MGTSDGRVVGTTQIVNAGPPSQRWNVVVMGDGYQASQLPQFAGDAQTFATALLSTPPFDSLRTAINVFRVDVASTDSGADDPAACGGTGATARTYFDASFCTAGIRRLLVVNNGTALSVAAAQVPAFHVVMVIVNSTVYGGSGGQVGVFSLAAGATEIALHELGHSAFALADEYEYYAGCGADVGHDRHPASEPAEANVTINTDRATLKWRARVAAATALPTTRNANCAVCDPQASPVPAATVGAFEGAHYYHCGAYRPQFNCRMRALGFPFCAVCQDRIRAVLAPFVPAATAVRGSAGLVQGRFGTRGNFEVVAPLATGGLGHLWRDNDAFGMPWHGPAPFGAAAGTVEAASLVQGTYDSPGNLEVVARAGNRLAHFWRDSGPAFAWNGPFWFYTGAAGTPSLVQGRFGTRGNFEVVAPLAAGGMGHFWRDNDAPGMPWRGPTPFGASAGVVDAVTLIQGNYDSPGNLEVVARVGNRLAHFWRDSGPSFTWYGPFWFYTGAAGTPSLVQGRFGTRGNFELVVPLAAGGLGHFWRDNDAPGMPWHGPTPFATGVGQVGAVSLVQGNYDTPGNLEVVARIGTRLAHFWRDSGPSFAWSGPFFLP